MYDHEVFRTRPLKIQNFSGAALGASRSTEYSTRITIRLQDFVAVSERISIQLAKVPVKVQQAAPGRGCASPAW